MLSGTSLFIRWWRRMLEPESSGFSSFCSFCLLWSLPSTHFVFATLGSFLQQSQIELACLFHICVATDAHLDSSDVPHKHTLSQQQRCTLWMHTLWSCWSFWSVDWEAILPNHGSLGKVRNAIADAQVLVTRLVVCIKFLIRGYF